MTNAAQPVAGQAPNTPNAWPAQMALADSTYPDLGIAAAAQVWVAVSDGLHRARSLAADITSVIQQIEDGEAEEDLADYLPDLQAELQEAQQELLVVVGEVRSLSIRLRNLMLEVRQRTRDELLARSTGELVCYCQVCQEEKEDEWMPWMKEESGEEEPELEGDEEEEEEEREKNKI